MRIFWFCLGLLSVGLGLIGVFLPLLPTVPFMILAAFSFARSSERLHSWLLSHKVFGPPIEDWRERGAINKRGKRLATVSIVAVFALSIILDVRMSILLIQALALTCVLLFIWTRPN